MIWKGVRVVRGPQNNSDTWGKKAPSRCSRSLVLRGVLAVEVVVLGLNRGLIHLVLGAVVVGVRVYSVLVSTGDAPPVVRGQELVHRVVRGVLVLGMRDHVTVLVLVVTIVIVVVPVPRGARLAPRPHHVQGPDLELLLGRRGVGRLRPEGHEGIILGGVLAVEVAVLGLRRGLIHLVLGAVVVGVRVHGVLVRTGDAPPVVRGQELVHRVVRGILVLGMRDHVPVLVLVVTIVIVVVPVPRGARL